MIRLGRISYVNMAPVFHRLTVELISTSIDMDVARRASAGLAEYLTPFIHQRRDEPGHDLISVLTRAEHDGQRLSDAEILAFCRLLLPAGAETTYRSSSNLVLSLLTHPVELEEVRHDRTLVNQAIEEGLRFAIREGGRTVGSGVVTKIEK